MKRSQRFARHVAPVAAIAFLGFASAMVPETATAQSSPYPSRRISVMVPFPPGGSADYFARNVFTRMSTVIGHPIIIENKPGAAGIVGTKTVINSPPDGYTLVVSSVASVSIAPNLSNPPAFDPINDLTPVTGIGMVPAVLVVRPQLGVKTFAELIEYAKRNPGKLNLVSSGVGTIAHFAGELLMQETGIKVAHIPHRGAPPAVTDLLGGHGDLMFSDAPFFLEHIRAGKLIPLAVGTSERVASLPNVPTTAEVGYPTIVASNTYSIFAPAHTPATVVNKLNELVRTVLKDPELQKAFATQEALPAGDTPERFAAFLKAESERWTPLAKKVASERK